MKLHDVGEGVAEAEIVEWLVHVGDTVTEDDVVADVMTDKATIELSSPVDGTVTWLGGEAGDVVAGRRRTGAVRHRGCQRPT